MSDSSLPAHHPGRVRFLNLEGGSYTLPMSDSSLPAHQPGRVCFLNLEGGSYTLPCLTLHSLPTSQGGSVFSTWRRGLTHYPRLTLHSLHTSQGWSVFSTWRGGGAYTLPTSDTSLPDHQPGMVRFLNLEGGLHFTPCPPARDGRFSQPGGGGLHITHV